VIGSRPGYAGWVRNERGARVARGSAIAVFATLAASLAHTLGGGLPPGPLAIVLALAFSVPFAVAMVGRRVAARAGGARAAIAAVGAQLALHACYSLGAGAGGPTRLRVTDASGGTRSSLMDGHSHGIAGVVDSAPGAASALAQATEPASVAAHAGHPGAVMLLTHVIAAVLTVAFIARADRVVAAVATTARGIHLSWLLTLEPSPSPGRAAHRPDTDPVIGVRRDRQLFSLRRRGPPLAGAAA